MSGNGNDAVDVMSVDTFEPGRFRNIDEAVDFAISLEDEGMDFYEDAASSTKDPGARDMFLYLAREEKKHAEYLRQFLESKCMDLEHQEIPDLRFSFSSEFEGDRMGEVGVMLSALRFERKSEDLYRFLSKQAPDGEQRDFFDKIADYEREHYELIDSMLEEATQFRMQT